MEVTPSSVPPSWEVLDEEARALGLEVSYEVDRVDGQGYVAYRGGGLQASFLDHPLGRQCAQESLEQFARGLFRFL